MITELFRAEKQVKDWFGGFPAIVLSAVLIGIAAFALYVALVEDHVAVKAGAVAWLLLP